MTPQILNPVEQIDHTFLLIIGISTFMLLGITVVSIFFLFRYHHSRNPEPTPIEGNWALEIIWTVVPLVLVMGMFVSGWTGFKAARTVPPGALEVKATAQMWKWTFTYPNGKVSDQLWAPQSRPTKVTMTSIDVLHSLFIPAFRVKIDVVPGRETYSWFLPEHTGEFTLFCAEYCGLEHAKMLAKVVIATQTEFDAWLKAPSAASTPATGPVKLLQEKSCLGCHSIDGSQMAGPTLKNLYGEQVTVLENGQERQVKADDAYLMESISEPGKQVVKGYSDVMPKAKDLSPDDVKTMVEYIKTLK